MFSSIAQHSEQSKADLSRSIEYLNMS